MEKNANTPTHPEDLAREAEYQTQARRKHDEALVRIAQEPQRYTPGLPKDLKIYTEVRLPLDGEKRRWPLTVVDIIGHSDDRCYLWGVVAYENRGTLRRDLKSIREARKYLFYNFGVESTLIMASGQREQIEALPVIEAELPPEHQAILRWR